jgi:hypothetical protein
MEMDAKNLKKLAEMLKGIDEKYMIKHGIQWFFMDEDWLCFQLFDKIKHVMLKIEMNATILKPYILVPREFAIKVLVLGIIPK